MERRFDAMARGSQRSGDDRAGREVAPPRRGGGLRLPGLKHWRRRRGFTQRELARRADLAEGYLLEVDLQDLRTKYDAHEVQAASTGGAQAASGPARSRVAYRHVHQAYLRIFLEREVGSSYAAMDEGVLEKHCEERAWEEVLEAVRARKREIEFLGEVLEDREVLQDRELPEEVRSFLEAVLESYPDLDIRLLAVARRRVLSEEGHEALTKAMGDLL